MGYASRSGRARASATRPQAFGVCDRCGCWENLVNLRWQFDWRGAALQNLRILVCYRCIDTPQQQLRAIVVPADPVPVVNARVEPFFQDEEYPALTSPAGLEQGAVMPLGLVRGVPTHLGVPVPWVSITSAGAALVNVTCSAPHGLQTNSQVSVEALSARGANGFFSVVVVNPMLFTYATYAAVPAGSLATSETRMITAQVGLPRGVTTIPLGP